MAACLCAVNVKEGVSAITSLAGVWLLLGSRTDLQAAVASATDANLTCSAGSVVVGLESDWYNYNSGDSSSPYLQLM